MGLADEVRVMAALDEDLPVEVDAVGEQEFLFERRGGRQRGDDDVEDAGAEAVEGIIHGREGVELDGPARLNGEGSEDVVVEAGDGVAGEGIGERGDFDGDVEGVAAGLRGEPGAEGRVAAVAALAREEHGGGGDDEGDDHGADAR